MWIHSLSLLTCSSLFFRGLLTGFLFSSLYYNLPTGDDSKAYIYRLNVFYFQLIYLIIPHLEDITGLQKDRSLFYRERSAGAYSPFAYWISRLLITIPFNVIGLFINVVLTYYACGLRDTDTGGGGYFLYLFTIFIITDTLGHLLAQITSNITPSVQVATDVYPIFVFSLASFEGFLIFLPNFPNWISWAAYFSFLRYSFQGLILNEFSGNDELPLSSTYIHNLGFEGLTTGSCFVILMIFVVLFCIAAYLTLYYIRFERR